MSNESHKPSSDHGGKAVSQFGEHVKPRDPLDEPARCTCRRVGPKEWDGCLLHEQIGYIDKAGHGMQIGPIFRFRAAP